VPCHAKIYVPLWTMIGSIMIASFLENDDAIKN